MPLSKGTEYEQYFFLRKLGKPHLIGCKQFSECFINMQMLFAAKCNNIFPFSHTVVFIMCSRAREREEVEWMMGSELHMFPRVKSWKVLCWAATIWNETAGTQNKKKSKFLKSECQILLCLVVYAFFDVAFSKNSLLHVRTIDASR